MFRDVTFPPQEAWPEEANARRLATVLKGLSDAFLVVDHDWRYQYVNQAMLDRMGVEESDLIGKAVWDLYPEAVGNEAYAQLQRAMNDRVTVDYEFFYEPWNGWYRARAYPIAEGGLAIYSSDVTEEKNSAEKARLGEELVSRLVELSPFGCYIIDSDFKFVQANSGSIDGAFAHIRPLLGRRFDEVVRILWPEDVADELIELFWHTLRTGEPYASKDFVEPRRDVDRVEGYEFSLHQITMPDGRPAVVCYYFDATELRDNERALRESESKLQDLNSELHRLVEERSQQLASSHKEVSGLLEKVAITREEEQRRIGQDLHDHLGQAVTGLRLPWKISCSGMTILSSWSRSRISARSRRHSMPM